MVNDIPDCDKIQSSARQRFGHATLSPCSSSAWFRSRRSCWALLAGFFGSPRTQPGASAWGGDFCCIFLFWCCSLLTFLTYCCGLLYIWSVGTKPAPHYWNHPPFLKPAAPCEASSNACCCSMMSLHQQVSILQPHDMNVFLIILKILSINSCLIPGLFWREPGRIWLFHSSWYVSLWGCCVVFFLNYSFLFFVTTQPQRPPPLPQWIVGKTGHNGSEKPWQFSSLFLRLSLSLCDKCTSLSLPKIMKTKSCLCILIPPLIPWAKYRAWDLSDWLWYSLGFRQSSAGLTH